MAEMRVDEKSKNRSPWLLVIGLVVIGLLIWFIVEALNNDNEVEEIGVEENELIEEDRGYADDEETTTLPEDTIR